MIALQPSPFILLVKFFIQILIFQMTNLLPFLFVTTLFASCQQQKTRVLKDSERVQIDSAKPVQHPRYFSEIDPKQLQILTNGVVYLCPEGKNSLPKYVSIDTLTHLQIELDWDEKRFPKEVFELKKLKYLWVGMRGFQSIPTGISNLRDLETIDFQHSAIQKLPADFCKLINLKTAIFLFSDLRSLPDCISELENLEELDLGYTKVVQFPDSMIKLKKLRRLLLATDPDGPQIPPSEIEKLRLALPDCYIDYRIRKI